MIKLKINGLQKKVSTGYSFKGLFFGFLYPIARGDMKGGLRHFLYASVTCGASLLFVPFFYNRKYIKGLIEQGYKPVDKESEDYLTRKFNYITQ